MRPSRLRSNISSSSSCCSSRSYFVLLTPRRVLTNYFILSAVINAHHSTTTTRRGGYQAQATTTSDDGGSEAYSYSYGGTIGDGICDQDLGYNVKECGYDGGDCCPCTCVSANGECGSVSYHCIDPTASCATDDTTSDITGGNFFSTGARISSIRGDDSGIGAESSGSVCYIPWIGDGYCDSTYNIASCGYDGGDCCECTCVSGNYTCGISDYDCLDPYATCFGSSDTSSSGDDATTTIGTDDYSTGYGCYTSWIGDGMCDSSNNNSPCDYDGGDCCECTCVSGNYTCGVTDYECIDPYATCFGSSGDDTTTTTGTDRYSTGYGCYTSWIGDGMCDSSNNNSPCDYDGGDCCECTCVSGNFTCGVTGYECIDPYATCFGSSDTSSSGDDVTTTIDYDDTDTTDGTGYYTDSSTGDDNTDDDSNSSESSGGDDTDDDQTASSGLDDDTAYPACSGYGALIGDGACDTVNNNENCNYDGGDCCTCTCLGSCEITNEKCNDPDASCFDSDSSSSSSSPSIVIYIGAGAGGVVLLGVVALGLCLCYQLKNRPLASPEPITTNRSAAPAVMLGETPGAFVQGVAEPGTTDVRALDPPPTYEETFAPKA